MPTQLEDAEPHVCAFCASISIQQEGFFTTLLIEYSLHKRKTCFAVMQLM
jgi:hypothetical protein